MSKPTTGTPKPTRIGTEGGGGVVRPGTTTWGPEVREVRVDQGRDVPLSGPPTLSLLQSLGVHLRRIVRAVGRVRIRWEGEPSWRAAPYSPTRGSRRRRGYGPSGTYVGAGLRLWSVACPAPPNRSLGLGSRLISPGLSLVRAPCVCPLRVSVVSAPFKKLNYKKKVSRTRVMNFGHSIPVEGSKSSFLVLPGYWFSYSLEGSLRLHPNVFVLVPGHVGR